MKPFPAFQVMAEMLGNRVSTGAFAGGRAGRAARRPRAEDASDVDESDDEDEGEEQRLVKRPRGTRTAGTIVYGYHHCAGDRTDESHHDLPYIDDHDPTVMDHDHEGYRYHYIRTTEQALYYTSI